MAEAAAALGMEVAVAEAPDEAVELAVSRAAADDGIVVCGSLYVVADALRLLRPGAR